MNQFREGGTTGDVAPGRGLQVPAERPRLMVVRCGPYHLGILAGSVQGVVGAGEIVPLGGGDLRGLAWRDGALLPVVSLGPLLGLAQQEGPIAGHGVVMKAGPGSLCFLVDEVMDLVELPPGSVMPLPRLVRAVVPSSAAGAVASLDRLLPIVDPAQLLGRDRTALLLAAAATLAASSPSAPSQV